MPNVTPEPSSTVHAVNLKVRGETRALIDRAARMQGRSRSDFMIEASRRAAEDAILDQTVISVDREAYDKFLAMLDAPPLPNEGLRRTMQTPAPWERP